MTGRPPSAEVDVAYIPITAWPFFFYKQQWEFIHSKAWQTWFLAGNGSGKTMVLLVNLVMQMYGIHPNQLGPPPLKVRMLVPSFDFVEDVTLEKLHEPKEIYFDPDNLDPQQEAYITFLRKNELLRNYDPKGLIEIGPILPIDFVKQKCGFGKEHKGIELKKQYGGSSLWFYTSEKGRKSQRGGEKDILACDEEGDERVWDELKRGLRNAKNGGKIYAGLTPPYEPGAGPTWTKEKILEASFEDPEIKAIRACMADNPSITPKFIKEFSKGKTQKQINVQVFGQYPTWGDLVHPDFQDRLWDPAKIDGHLLPNDTPMPESHHVDWVMAFDWHASKPCAAVFGFIDSDGNPTFFDELDIELAEDKTISEVSELFLGIEGQPWHKRRFRRWQDPSAKSKDNAVRRGYNAWKEFRNNGIITAAGKNRDPEVGISIVNDYFKGNAKDHPRIFLYERLKCTRRYLTNHFWKRSPESGKAVPDPKWSDFPITIRYIVQEVGWKDRQKSHRKRRWPLASYHEKGPERPTINLGGIDR